MSEGRFLYAVAYFDHEYNCVTVDENKLIVNSHVLYNNQIYTYNFLPSSEIKVNFFPHRRNQLHITENIERKIVEYTYS